MDQREDRPSKVGRVTAQLANGGQLAPEGSAEGLRPSSALGDGFTASFELALTPAVLGLIGLFLDRWLGTTPLLTVVLAVLGLVGMVARLYYGYNHEMESLDATRRGRTGPEPMTSSEVPA